MTSEVTLRPIETIRSGAHLPDSSSERRLQQLSSTIVSLGFSTPVLVDADGQVVAGRGRVEAARALGISEIPCLSTAAMSAAEKNAYFLAHQTLAIKAGWDEDLLASELSGALDDPKQTARHLNAAQLGESLGPDDEPATRPGDLWIMGPHRLLCGQASDPAAYAALMGEALAELVITDPLCPASGGTEDGEGGAGHRLGEDASAPLTRYLTSVFVQLAKHSHAGSVHYISSDWRRMRPMLDAGEAVYGQLANLIIWVKDDKGAGGFCGSGHELVFAFEKLEGAGKGQHAPSKRSHRRDIWKHVGGAALHIDEAGDGIMLPTERPVELIAQAILDSTEPGAIVLDAFCGSGTMLAAAHNTGRLARALEKDPRHCDRTVERWQELTGESAFLSETGLSFAEVKRLRCNGG